MVCTNPLPMCWCTRTPEHRAREPIRSGPDTDDLAQSPSRDRQRGARVGARELVLATVSEGERACASLRKPPVGLIGGAAEEVVLSPVRPSVPETDRYRFCICLR